jgi:hypothetical protein
MDSQKCSSARSHCHLMTELHSMTALHSNSHQTDTIAQ